MPNMAAINFSLPIIPSFTSTEPNKLRDVKLFDRSITQQVLFIPDINILLRFANGELGIADAINKSMILKNLSKIEDPEIIQQFLKAAGGEVEESVENFIKNGKASINPEKLKLKEIDGNLGGLKALERAMIQSIFEAQKPYMDVFKLVIQNLVKIEDIIARVLAISGSSMNPKVNPKALGYQGNKDFQEKMSQLDGLIKADTGPKELPDEEESTPEQITEDPRLKGGSWVTQSVVYSTGEFDPNVEYDYIYEYSNQVKEGVEINQNGTFSVPPVTGDEHLPKYVVFGVFDSDLNPIDENLITTTLADARLDGTVSKNVNWINRSGKWFGEFDQIKEGEDFNFVRDRYDNIVKYGEEGPKIEVGPDDDKEIKWIKKGFPKITGINTLINYYNQYYLDETKRRAQKKGLSASQIDGVVAEIGNKLSTTDEYGTSGIQTTIEASLEKGFLNLSDENNTTGLSAILGKFNNIKFPFKPKKVSYNGEQIWIDPEAKYDMKIIKCDSSTDITFLDVESDNQKFKTTKIIRFVRDTLSIRLNDNSQFYYEILNPQNLPIPNFGTTVDISIDNTLSGNFGGVFNPGINGTLNVYARYMPSQYANGIIFTSPEDGLNYRLSKFSNNWKIEQVYWTINSVTREGDIVSLSVYGSVKKETGIDGVQRVRVKFPDGNFYYFSTFDGQFLHRKVFERSIAALQAQDIYQSVIATINPESGGVNIAATIIPPNSIRVEDPRYKFGRLISNTQVLNERLADKTKPFSNGSYGSPVNGSKQNIEQIYRFQQTEDDTETYYIIEGVLSSENNNKLGVTQNAVGGSSQRSGGDYSFPDFIGVIPVFIEMLIDVFAKLIPTITSLIDLITDPTKFITDIIIAKIGDNNGTEPEKFGIFSKKFFDDLKKISKVGISGLDSTLSSSVSNLSNALSQSANNPISAPNLGNLPNDVLDKISGIGNDISENVNAAEDKLKKLELKKKLDQIIKNSKLNNYVYVTPDGKPKFLMDGLAKINLFGDAPALKKLPSITFGLEMNLSSLASSSFSPLSSINIDDVVGRAPQINSSLTGISKNLGESVKNALTSVNTSQLLSSAKSALSNIPKPFKVLSGVKSPFTNFSLPELSGLVNKVEQKVPTGLANFNFEPTLNIPSEILSKVNDEKFFYQSADIQRNFQNITKDTNFEYAYIFQNLQNKILEAQKLDLEGDSAKALEILEEVKKLVPNDTNIDDVIGGLKEKTLAPVQPILKFMLSLVSLPLKVIFGIISYIMDLFKSFLNPFELPFKIIDFVSFKWMLDFFNPTSKNSIFSMLGMKFDIQTYLTVFVPGLITKFQQQFDMSKIINMPFFAGKLPKYNQKQFDLFHNLRNGSPSLNLPNIPQLPKLPSIPTLVLSNILCFIEAIINAIIDFIWGILGLGSVIPTPHIKLCKNTNQNLTAKDIVDLLNGEVNGDADSYNFTFNIKTSDGRDIRGLNNEELEKWLEENQDLEINFDF